MSKTNKKQKKAAALKEKRRKTLVHKTNITTIQKKKKTNQVNNLKKSNNISDSMKNINGISSNNIKQLIKIKNEVIEPKKIIDSNKSKKKKMKKNKIQLQQANGNNKQNKETVKSMLMSQHNQTKQLNAKTMKKKNNSINKILKLKKITEKKIKYAKDDNVISINNTELVNDKNNSKTKKDSKVNIQLLREMLATKEKSEKKPKKIKETLPLRERMMMKLKASRFRYLNETLYNNTSTQSKKYFKEDPDSFIAYHDGYKQQVAQWPLNPLDVIIASIKNMPNDYIIADFGCGEAMLAASIQQKTHSFDLISVNEKVQACDMSHTPLLTNSVHIVVFCLSLMGTNLGDYILEANRVLKKDGILKIAEIESRFDHIEDFIKLLNDYGFMNTWKDLSQNLFYFLDFKKIKDITTNKNKLPMITLKSCLYKKR
ncbi:ribosomal RNA-processing protein 8 isoform X1 [Vespa velutina]|uniref:ribosomal RNA-processing protein 8 isoform X1 n=2 Tax=Vespa velutina TaxID=202808 RepID=UPI001FB24BC6|nr:ribosomal RNA-processing protein 8 isoform X1 [Vespa velutina]